MLSAMVGSLGELRAQMYTEGIFASTGAAAARKAAVFRGLKVNNSRTIRKQTLGIAFPEKTYIIGKYGLVPQIKELKEHYDISRTELIAAAPQGGG